MAAFGTNDKSTNENGRSPEVTGRCDCLARPKRFELLTPWFVARYSIQLSYGRVSAIITESVA